MRMTDGLESLKASEDSSLVLFGAQESLRPLENGSVTRVGRGGLRADSLLPDGSKRYVIKAPKESIVIFFFKVNTEGARLDVEAEGPINRTKVAVIWLPAPYIYYVREESEVQLLVSNPQAHTVYYEFYIDVSEPLGENNSKILPLKSGKVAFHVDLRKDDRTLLKLDSINNSDLRIWVFVMYHEILPGITHKLHLYRRSLYGSLYFNADFARRYYIIVDSVDGEEGFSLTSSISSAPWNQDWFWLLVLFSFFATAVSLTDVAGVRRLEKTALFALLGYYCWFLTIGLSFSAVGSLSYGALIYMPLVHLMIFFYGLSHIAQIYAAHLDRKATSQICPSCGRKVDLKQVNYCCGRIVKNVSVAWFFLPLSLGFLFFAISYIIFQRVVPVSLSNSLWMGSCGSIIGGIVAWWTNRNIYRIRLWKANLKRYYIPGHIRFVSIGLLATGILFSLLSPLLIGIVLEGFLTQHVESFLGASVPWIRIRIAPLTLSIHVVAEVAILAIVSGFLVAYRIRRILARSASRKEDPSGMAVLDDLA